mmetsp:Transcript_60002/g.176079  ORF Transcript_60002/g.176079 Transcript_60002/m.176079 type:complete len:265 (+) Transcript_60002:412-1206(+)
MVFATGPDPGEVAASPPSIPARHEVSYPRVRDAGHQRRADLFRRQRPRASREKRLSHRERHGCRDKVATSRSENQVQRGQTAAVLRVGVRQVPEKQRHHPEVAAPDGVVQRGVRLGVGAARARPRTGAQQQLDGLAAVRGPQEVGARHRELQGELAAALEAEAARVGLRVALEQQPNSRNVGLSDGLVEGVLARAGVPSLQRDAEERHRLLVHGGLDVVLHLHGLLPRARPERRADGDDLRRCRETARWRRGHRWQERDHALAA